MTIIGPDAYLSKHSNENSYFADEIAPIPPRNTWDELPPAQLIDIKTRLIRYSESAEDSNMKASLLRGVAYVDALMIKASQR